MCTISKVLIVLDSMESSYRLLKQTVPLVNQLAASLMVLHVIADPYRHYGSYIASSELKGMKKEVLQHAHEKLDEIIKKVSFKKINCKGEVIIGQVGDVVNYINEKKIDLVIVGAHQQTAFDRSTLGGSNARKLARLINVPIMYVKPLSTKKN